MKINFQPDPETVSPPYGWMLDWVEGWEGAEILGWH
jgi:hypothetical protein